MKTRNYLTITAILSSLVTTSVFADVTEEDFKVKTTRNLINLCTASSQDVHYGEAIHFCQGYLVGAFHYHISAASNDPEKQLVCFPEPKPTRNEAIDQFVKWTVNHPEYMSEIPVDTEFRFLAAQYPCKKS